jgi:hypothetical protein
LFERKNPAGDVDAIQDYLDFLDPILSKLGETAPEKGSNGTNHSTIRIELIDGGFALNGTPTDLTGRPLSMLRALLQDPNRRCGARKLREVMKVNDEAVTYPEQVVRDTAAVLRSALRQALAALNVVCSDPLPSVGKGEGLTYKLNLP